MSDNTPRSELAFMLGRIQGDVKHILEALTENNKRFAALDTKIVEIERRQDKSEKFQVKVATVMAIATPILLTALTFGVRLVFGV